MFIKRVDSHLSLVQLCSLTEGDRLGSSPNPANENQYGMASIPNINEYIFVSDIHQILVR